MFVFNLFEHEATRPAAQAPGPGKPQIESELLQALERALAEGARQHPAVLLDVFADTKSSNDTLATLPDEPARASSLAQRWPGGCTARAGQGAPAAERPGHAGAAQRQASADRFDFETLAHHPREPEEGTHDR